MTVAPAWPARKAAGGDVATEVVAATAADLSAAIATAFTKLQTAGKASGRLVITGNPGDVAVISNPVVLDLGYADVANVANYTAGNGEVFELVCEVPVRPAAGVARAITVRGGRNATIRAWFDGGGQRRSAADAAITAGQATLTSATLAFTAADVGKAVMVLGAGPSGYPLHATVLSVAAGVATLSDNAATTVAAGTAVIRDVALHLENLFNADIDVRANGYAGTVLHADATGDATRRLRSCRVSRAETTDCGQGIFLKWIEAFGPFDYVWDNGNVDGIYFGNCDDVGIGHLENFSPATHLYGLDFDTCNNLNIQTITLGDRATGALLLIRGAGGSSDFGSIEMVRATGWTGGRPPAAVKLEDVNSVTIDKVRTRDTVKGIHIVGGSGSAAGAQSSIVIGSHHSLTGDTNPLYIEPSAAQTAPRIIAALNYRTNDLESVKIAAGLTGGRATLRGYIGQPNDDGAGATYAIDCASAAFELDVAGLYQKQRNTLAGAINHGDPTKVLGVNRAWLEGNNTATDAISHGEQPAVIATPTTGTDQRNTDPRPQWVALTVRLDPTAGADAQAKLYVGLWGVGLGAGGVQEAGHVTRKATELAGDEHLFLFQVPAYGRWQIVLTNATVTLAKGWHV